MMHKALFFYAPVLRTRVWGIALLAFAFVITSCSRRMLPGSSPEVPSSQMQAFISSGTGKRLNTHQVKPDQVIRTAGQFLGTPHCMGGMTKRCIDCSGLTYASFAAHQIELPRRSQDQARYGRIITERRELKRGDLVFFTRSYQTSDYITHVGIYLGKSRFIHASTSSGVVITPLETPWWSSRFVFGTRIF